MVTQRSRVNGTPQPASDAMLRGVDSVLSALVARGAPVCVGLSGGIDSVVLFDAVTRLASHYKWRISAIHVNHQLSPYAPQWARFWACSLQ